MPDYITAFWQTNLTIGATGATTLVAAPGTNSSLILDAAVVMNRTTTAGIFEGYINQTTTAGGILAVSDPYGVAATGGVPGIVLAISGLDWRLETNAALSFISTLTSASTMAAYVFVRGRTLRRTQ